MKTFVFLLLIAVCMHFALAGKGCKCKRRKKAAPTVADCPAGDWVILSPDISSCYLFNTTANFYSVHRDTCEAFGATLVQIEDSVENNLIKDFATNNVTLQPSTGYWIGLQNVNGVEKLPSGENATFFDWNGDQPDAGQSCGALIVFFQYRWGDVECSVTDGEGDSDGRKLFAVCEFELSH